jgi:hypothetical protein
MAAFRSQNNFRRTATNKGVPTMSEAEIYELALMTFDSAANQVGLLLTLIFAYLATAYFVGGLLTRFQTAVVSFLFIIAGSIFTLGLYGTMQRSISFVDRLRDLHPEEVYIMSETWAVSMTILLALAIPVCLFFMYQIRRQPRLGAKVQ